MSSVEFRAGETNTLHTDNIGAVWSTWLFSQQRFQLYLWLQPFGTSSNQRYSTQWIWSLVGSQCEVSTSCTVPCTSLATSASTGTGVIARAEA